MIKNILILLPLFLISCTQNTKEEKHVIAEKKIAETSITRKKSYFKNEEKSLAQKTSSSIDTTTYFSQCFNSVLINEKDIFKTIENTLIKHNILINNNPKSYKRFFYEYLISANIGLNSTLDIHEAKKDFFDNKLLIAQILNQHLKLPKDYSEKLNKCFENIFIKKSFEQSSFKKFTNQYEDFFDLIINGNLKEKDTKDNLIKNLDNIFSVEPFSNRDVQRALYLQIWAILKDYNNETKEQEYLEVIRIISSNKKDQVNSEKQKEITVKKTDKKNKPFEIEVIEDDENFDGIIEETVPYED